MTKWELMRVARQSKRIQPTPPSWGKMQKKLRFRKHPKILKNTMRTVIKGSFGIISEIARRLDVKPAVVERCLAQEGWEDLMGALEVERGLIKDVSLRRLLNTVLFSSDEGSAAKAAMWFLEKLDPDYRKVSKVQVEGGDKPIQHQSVVVNIPAEALNRPLDVREAILGSIESLEEKDAG